LSGDFIRLVSLAFLIAVPIAWWAIHQWLQNFAYHATPGWWIFVISGVMMLALALLILCIRAGRAAMANPIDSLRTEALIYTPQKPRGAYRQSPPAYRSSRRLR
jgi:drug/metabolite transporter (DMT)-like permease